MIAHDEATQTAQHVPLNGWATYDRPGQGAVAIRTGAGRPREAFPRLYPSPARWTEPLDVFAFTLDACALAP